MATFTDKTTFLIKSLKVITFFYVVFSIVMLLVDTVIYPHWGIRLDATILTYLNTPTEMLASLKSSQLIIAVVIFISSVSLTYFFFSKIISKNFAKTSSRDLSIFAIYFVLIVIGIRGGLQKTSINHSNIYFSTNQYANHLANNGVWNFGHSYFNEIYNQDNPYALLQEGKAHKIAYTRIKEIHEVKSSDKKILNCSNPNIILIIWESLTAKVVGPLNGYPDVTPNLNRLSNEGLLFTNFYANGDRSDKGLVSILSGYYPQCKKSIIKTPTKSKNLPFITKPFVDSSYNCSFYYGGDLNFGNMNSYLLNAGLNEIVSGADFDKKNWNSKWGVHDHVVLEKAFDDLKLEGTSSFFKTIFTLTSHEPYEIPEEPRFKEDTEIDRFKSAHYYTDHSINQFLEKAKKEDWWDNTLVIITADHGHRLPIVKGNHNAPQKFHIPMLWIGGALDSTGVIENFGSQKDIGYTLLSELNYTNQLADYPFSKNLLIHSSKNYAHYIFNNGYGTIDKNGSVLYDYHAQKIIESSGTDIDTLELLGQALTQSAYQDYLDR